MSTPIEDLKGWIEGLPEAAGYLFARGPWRETPENEQRRIVAVMADGGGTPGVIERYPRARVLILGARGERNVTGAIAELEAFADAMLERSREVHKAGCLAHIRAIGDILGPGFTTEDRPWYELNFQLIR